MGACWLIPISTECRPSADDTPIRVPAVVGFAFHLLLSMFIALPSVTMFFAGVGRVEDSLGYSVVHDIVFPLVFFILFVLYWRLPHLLRRSVALIVLMAVAYLVPGAIRLLLPQGLLDGSYPVVLSGVLTGTGQALGYILWQQTFARGRGRGIVVEVTAGTALAGALYFIATWFPAEVFVPFTYLSLGISCAALALLAPVHGECVGDAVALSQTSGIALCIREYWTAILVIALIGFVWGIFQVLSASSSPRGYLSSLYALGRIAAAILVVAYLAARHYRLELGVFVKLVLPVCVTATLLYPLFGETVCSALAIMYYVLFGISSIAMIIFCADVARRLGLHPSVPYCLFFGLIYLFSKAGLQVGRAVTASMTPLDNLTFELVVALVIVYLFAMLGFVLQRQHATPAPEHPACPTAVPPQGDGGTSLRPKAAGTAAVEAGSEDRFSEFGLTPREHEIAMMLVKGRDVAYICEELSLSKNTVRTHVKNVYQKTGVHGKQELISLDERLRNGRAPSGEVSPSLGEVG